MYTESYCGQIIYPVSSAGVLDLYERSEYRAFGSPKYVVFHRNGRALEEFRKKRDALKWMNCNRNG